MTVPLTIYRPPTDYDPEALGAQCSRCFLRSCRAGGPVPPEIRGGSFAIVAEAPGENEVEDMRPFTGKSGKELTLGLKLAGVQRGEYDLLNAISCRPVGNQLSRLNIACKRANDAIEKTNKAVKKAAKEAGRPVHPRDLTPKWLTPFEACLPRLYRELADGGYTNLLPVGKISYQALLGESKSLQDVRGGMLEGWFAKMDQRRALPSFVEKSPDRPWSDSNLPAPDARAARILPTLHPAFVLRQRRWTSVFRSDLKRAVDWFLGRAVWEEPEHIGGMHAEIKLPDPDWLYEWLLPQEVLTYDTETDGLEALLAKVRCVSIGNDTQGVVIPFMSKVDPARRFYDRATERRMIDVLNWWWTSKEHLKVGWNLGFYDRLIVEQNFGVTPNPVLDCMMLHRVVDPELPHGLGFAASVYASLSPAWKANRAATDAETDAELHRYASLDAVQNNRLCEPLVALAEQREQIPVFLVDCGMQNNAVNLHRIGIKCDVPRRNQWETLLLEGGIDPVEEAKWAKKNANWNHEKHLAAWAEWEKAGKPNREDALKRGLPMRPEGPRVRRGARIGTIDRPSYLSELKEHAGRDLNPNSVHQVRDLLFEQWRLPIPLGANDKPKMTKGGDPSTDDETIRALLIHPLVRHDRKTCDKHGYCLNCHIVGFLDALRFYRASMKLWGTYIKRLIPNTAYAEADAFDMNVIDDAGRLRRNVTRGGSIVETDVDEYEEAELAAADLTSQKEKVKGFLWPDGRIRADWKAHVTTVGRFACGNPNLLNLPSELRDMIVPEDGHCFVGADADQIHMRIFSALWGLKLYLRVLELGGDPHAMTALMMFGDEFRYAEGFPPGRWIVDGGVEIFIPRGAPGDKWDGLAKKNRALSKTLAYAAAYAATDDTVHRVATSAEDTEGNLIYANLSPASTRDKVNKWKKALGIEKGWELELRLFRESGYLVDPVLGRRRDLLDLQYSENEKEGKSDIINARTLTAEGSIMSKATNAFTAAYPWDHEKKTGLVHQNYDSMCAEADADIREIRKEEKRYESIGKPLPKHWEEIDHPDLREAMRVASLMTTHMTWREESLPGVIGTAVAQHGANLKEA